MITLHYLENSRSHRILWMLEELGAQYKLEVYRRDKRTNLAPASMKAIHPLGKSPVLTDGDVTVAESGAIVEYLAERCEGMHMMPTEGEDGRQCRYWLHFAEGSLMAPLVTRYVFSVAGNKVPFFLRPVLMFVPNAIEKAYLSQTIKGNLDFVESHLTGREFFVGDALSVADVMMIFPLEAATGRTKDVGPNTRAYVKRIQARPAYQAALKAAGLPYVYA